MVLQVEMKSVYGNTLIYPVCDKAKTFAKLIGKKTFSNSDMNVIRELGYTFIGV